MQSGRWAEAAHLFWPILAPIWMMLPSRRRHAGRFDVGVLSTARAFAPATAERVFLYRGTECHLSRSAQTKTRTPIPVCSLRV
eukprot:2515487-Prymnesium_polylepis.1